MFKFGTIGAFKQVRNNPRCKADKDFLIGTAVVLDESKKTAKAPTSEEIKKDLYVVGNIIDKPEVHNSKEYKVLKGEYVRGFFLSDLNELTVELDYRVIDTDFDTIKVGDKLTAKADTGLWEKSLSASGYKICLEVLEKTSFGDKGVLCIVRIA